jgi:hypothetical protein
MKSLLRLLSIAVVAGYGFAAAAQEQVKLFKIVTAKDDIVIGLTADDVRTMGGAPELDKLAQWLNSAGQITVWRYAVGRDAGGNLQQTPSQRVAVFKNDTLRIEPFTSPLPVAAPPKQ